MRLLVWKFRLLLLWNIHVYITHELNVVSMCEWFAFNVFLCMRNYTYLLCFAEYIPAKIHLNMIMISVAVNILVLFSSALKSGASLSPCTSST